MHMTGPLEVKGVMGLGRGDEEARHVDLKGRCQYIIIIKVATCPQEVVQSAGTTPHETEAIRSNPPCPLLCGHVKKKKKKVATLLRVIKIVFSLGCSAIILFFFFLTCPHKRGKGGFELVIFVS
jgi:hypothetical protein